VVGPRPERPYFVEKFVKDTESYNSRHYMKGGITGWAQINGLRGDTSIPERIRYDLYYMRNWSLGFDLQIILLTLIRGFTNKNAY
jgi:lipopolysaccharide/colanic/teichoic acid biosynthesis glycosyltransferase